MAMSSSVGEEILNFNIGILGHVDSGKTSLAIAMSTNASTAAFDRNPQSQERGITIDLGFSSFRLKVTTEMVAREPRLQPYDVVEVTLVDCPGHASLIRAVLGAASIIDMMLLVVDINKGIQTQTAECLLLGEITCPNRAILVLNKIDLLPSEEVARRASIDKMEKRVRKTLATTSYKNIPMVAVAAAPDGKSNAGSMINMDVLMHTLQNCIFFPERTQKGDFLLAVDHCFGVKGQGTVMTGTILSGKVKVGDTIEIPSLKEQKKVKSIQRFKKPIQEAIQGDRIGVCVTQFDAKLLERGLVSKPGLLSLTYATVVTCNTISYYKQPIKARSKYHVSIGYETVLARCTFFGCETESESKEEESCRCASIDNEGADDVLFSQFYHYQNELLSSVKSKNSDEKSDVALKNEFNSKHQFALLEFEHPILFDPTSLYIAARLDADIHANQCRLAFYGKVLHLFSNTKYASIDLERLKIYKNKSKQGTIDRVLDDYSIVVNGIVKKQTNLDFFTNLKVELDTGEVGFIEGAFGQSGKIRVRIASGLKETTKVLLEAQSSNKKKRGKGGNKPASDDFNKENITASNTATHVRMYFRRYIYDPQKKMVQI